MTTCKQGPGVTHHGGCPCWEARQAEEVERLAVLAAAAIESRNEWQRDHERVRDRCIRSEAEVEQLTDTVARASAANKRWRERVEYLDNLVRLARDATREGSSEAWSEWLDMLYVYEDDNGLPHERED